jgi:3-phosphoshikimate 1-carboxyvinyltransferase
LLAAIADHAGMITGALDARDTQLMAAALRNLGVGVDESGAGWTVTPGALHNATIDTGLAGTVMRFVPPIAALASGDVHFDGDAYARSRPMATLFDGLRQAGVDIDDGGTGRMPFTVRGRGIVTGGVVEFDSSASSQFVSALLLAGARYDKGVQVRHTGKSPVPSLPHIAMTVAALRARGVTVDDSERWTWAITPGPIGARDVAIEPDLSNAAPFLAAAMVTGGSVTIPGWPRATDQAGDALRELLALMGARIELTDEGLTLHGSGRVRPLTADLGGVGELTPVLAALAALADGPSELTGIAHLRGHETDRLAALAREITALGGRVQEDAGGLRIQPAPLRGGVWHAYADHRMAQAGAVLGLVVAGIEIDDIACTTKTLADFPGLWADLLGG